MMTLRVGNNLWMEGTEQMKKPMRMFFLLAGILSLVLGTVVPAFAEDQTIEVHVNGKVYQNAEQAIAAGERLQTGVFDQDGRWLGATLEEANVTRAAERAVEEAAGQARAAAFAEQSRIETEAKMKEFDRANEERKANTKGQLQLTNGQVVDFDLNGYSSPDGKTITAGGVTYLETPQGFVAQTIEPQTGGNSYETQGAVRPKFGTKILPTPKTLSGNPVGLSDLWEADKESKAGAPIIEEKSAVIPLEENNELPKVLISH